MTGPGEPTELEHGTDDEPATLEDLIVATGDIDPDNETEPYRGPEPAGDEVDTR